MAGRCWSPSQAKKFAKELKLGHTYWVVHKVATNVARYEDEELCSGYVFDRRAWGTNTPMSYTMSAVQLCQTAGPVYEDKPRGVRSHGDPTPQCAPPLPEGYVGRLDEAEISGLEKRVRDGSNPRTRKPAHWRI